MCTLCVVFRLHGEAPLVVAANRDERLDRPSAPPELREDGRLPVLAPRDLRAGGTWLGLNAAGVFAGITNRWGRPPDPARRSRGLLVLEALEEEGAHAGAARAARRAASEHNAFHLVVADREQAFLVVNDGAAVATEELRPGIHVVTERSHGAGATRRPSELAEAVATLPPGPRPDLEGLRGLLTRHGDVPLEGTCIHDEPRNYGTRSSTLVVLGSETILRHAHGPPCRTPHLPVKAARVLPPFARTSGPRPADRLPGA